VVVKLKPVVLVPTVLVGLGGLKKGGRMRKEIKKRSLAIPRSPPASRIDGAKEWQLLFLSSALSSWLWLLIGSLVSFFCSCASTEAGGQVGGLGKREGPSLSARLFCQR